MSNANDSYEDLEQQGEPAVRRWANTVLPLDADQVALKRAKAWLHERETERATLASERKENREIDALRVARQSLANSQRATRIAILSLVLSIVLASSIADGADGIRIVATDEKLEAPRTMPAGIRHIIFENRGKQVHEAMFMKLTSGMSVAGFQKQLDEGILFPEGVLDYSGAGLMSPGGTTEVWLPLDPGEYVLICWNHTRNSVRGLTVADGKRVDDTPPREDAVLLMRDFQFELQGHLKKGTRVIKVQSSGPSLHEADLFRLHPGHSASDVQRWYKNDLGDPAPADALGGILDSSDTNHVVWLRHTFSPGRYVFHCATPLDTHAKSGEHSPVHADVGMVMTFEVDQ